MGKRFNICRSRRYADNTSRTATVEPMATSLLIDIPPYDYLDEPRRKRRPKPSLPTVKFVENQGGQNG